MNRSTHRRISIVAAAILGAALAVGSVAVAVGQSLAPAQSPATTSPAPTTLSVEGAWARVSPMMDRAGAAYLVIRNSGMTEDALVAVSSPAAAIVELHETVANASGEMMMQPVVAIPVPVGGVAELKPGSYHIMLIDLLEPLTEGATIDLTLTFQSGTVMTVTAPVQSGMPMGSGMPAGSSAPMGSAVPMGSPAP